MLLKMPKGSSSISVQGVTYKPDAANCIDVTDPAHVTELMGSHGMLTPELQAAADAKAEADFNARVLAAMAKSAPV